MLLRISAIVKFISTIHNLLELKYIGLIYLKYK